MNYEIFGKADVSHYMDRQIGDEASIKISDFGYSEVASIIVFNNWD